MKRKQGHPFLSLFNKDTQLLHIQSNQKNHDYCFQIVLSKNKMHLDLGASPHRTHHIFEHTTHPYSTSQTSESKLAQKLLQKAYKEVQDDHAFVVGLS